LKPSAGKAVPGSPEQARLAIESFLDASKTPVVVETGLEPIPVGAGNHTLAWRSGYLTLEVWDEERILSRRIVGIETQARGRLELSIERFGKRPGTLTLVDTSATQDVSRRVSRTTFRERFRRALTRQYPGWRIAELSTEADLEHSLSPSYPRALIRIGTKGLAVIGAGSESDVDSVLTFGLVWLDYLRSRERRMTIEGLVVFLPAGSERTTCLRLRCLNPRAARFDAFVQTEDGYEDRVDLSDYGNLDTQLDRCSRPLPDASA
jgi:hypothetical protein